ncbi:MAG: HepT-like ribonuclease domain-containing protein [Pseudonocardiaceae bacterium]
MLLELDALLEQIQSLATEGDREQFDKDDRYRWVLHRLWIAVGNEALAYARLTGRNPQVDQPWARLYRLRNMLAHDRLPDIDEDEVWRMTAVRPAALRAQVRGLLS